jgi:hypothetical protein
MKPVTQSLIVLLSLLVFAPSSQAHRPIVPRGLGDIELLCGGSRCEEVTAHGQRWVVGSFGERYEIALINRSDLWLEAVVTVDGLSILDGLRSSSRSRGYLIPPRDRVVVDGWRVSRDAVAAFRFTSVGDSYAGRIGDSSDVGAIRVDFYPERRTRTWMPPPEPWEGRRAPDASPGHSIDDFAAGDSDRPRTAEKSAGAPASRWERDTRQGLGTQFGEERHQPVSERDFERANPHQPSQSLALRYDDRAGLVARGVLPRRDDRHWVRPPPRRFIPFE